MHIIPYYPSAAMLFPKEVFVLKIQDGWISGDIIVYVGAFSDSLTLGGECSVRELITTSMECVSLGVVS